MWKEEKEEVNLLRHSASFIYTTANALNNSSTSSRTLPPSIGVHALLSEVPLGVLPRRRAHRVQQAAVIWGYTIVLSSSPGTVAGVRSSSSSSAY
jgi:hypothetical protein